MDKISASLELKLKLIEAENKVLRSQIDMLVELVTELKIDMSKIIENNRE